MPEPRQRKPRPRAQVSDLQLIDLSRRMARNQPHTSLQGTAMDADITEIEDAVRRLPIAERGRLI